jgi:ArsR family transcriptional regulator, lead/cadmium/zinc/bismuth-responsive transcriptional repressor
MNIDVFLILCYLCYMYNKCYQKNSKKQHDLQEIKDDFDILSDVNRLRILCLLRENNEMCVCEIFVALDLPQNLASYHLSKLKESGFVKSRKEGANVVYQSEKKKIKKFLNLIKLTLIKQQINL